MGDLQGFDVPYRLLCDGGNPAQSCWYANRERTNSPIIERSIQIEGELTGG